MKPAELKERTKRFAVDIIKLVEALPKTLPGETVASPLIRCGTAVGSTYRSACISKNGYDFLARLGVVEDATDETCYWLELILETKLVPAEGVTALHEEGRKLRRIFGKSRKAALRRRREEIRGGNDPLGEPGEDDIPF